MKIRTSCGGPRIDERSQPAINAATQGGLNLGLDFGLGLVLVSRLARVNIRARARHLAVVAVQRLGGRRGFAVGAGQVGRQDHLARLRLPVPAASCCACEASMRFPRAAQANLAHQSTLASRSRAACSMISHLRGASTLTGCHTRRPGTLRRRQRRSAFGRRRAAAEPSGPPRSTACRCRARTRLCECRAQGQRHGLTWMQT